MVRRIDPWEKEGAFPFLHFKKWVKNWEKKYVKKAKKKKKNKGDKK